MSPIFWRQIHGGSTHFPIVLLLASVVFDFVAWRSRDGALRRGLRAAALGSAVVGMLGGVGAVVAGLIVTRGRVLGGGYERIHHLFVWPAVVACVVCVCWRLFRRGGTPWHGLGVYLAGMSLVTVLMIGAGYSGGEMLLSAESGDESAPTELAVRPLVGAKPPDSRAPNMVAKSDQRALVIAGHQLFLKNCAHCHGADAHGDEGPDLHHLDWRDEQIAARIRNGKKGQMPAFAGKFSPSDIRAVIAYLRTLN